MSTLTRLLTTAAVGAMAAIAACGNDMSTDPEPKPTNFLPRTSPTNLLHNLKQSYAERNLTEFDSLLAGDFIFVLSPEDQIKPDMPDSWGRNTEIQIHANLFDNQFVQAFTLDFAVEDVLWDSTFGMYSILITHVNLYLYGSTPGHPTEVKEYRVTDNRSRFWFRRNPWTTGARHDSVWTIVRWEDSPVRAGVHSGLAESNSWGALKAIFRDATR